MAKINKKSILMIGVKSSSRDSLASRLRLSGPNVEIASSGFHAMAMLEDPSNTFDYCLLYKSLGDLSTKELILNILTIESINSPDILVMQDFNTKDEIEEITNSGARAVFATEIPFSDLIKKIELL